MLGGNNIIVGSSGAFSRWNYYNVFGKKIAAKFNKLIASLFIYPHITS